MSDNDLANRLRQFEVVCKTALKLIGAGSTYNVGRRVYVAAGGLEGLANAEFGLDKRHVKYCLGRARNFLAEVHEAERRRNRIVFMNS